MQQRQIEEISIRLQKTLEENKRLASELYNAQRSSANELPDADNLLTSKECEEKDEEDNELIKDTREKIESLDKEFENLYKIS
jgi:hypothetical protein